MKNQLERNLATLLEQCLPHHQFSEVYRYAVLPAGKLFRPKLVLAAFDDAGGDTRNLPLNHDLWAFACALEIHHAYTLAHDDLPAMDDDQMRRGRPATHKAYGEWQAILAGDALAIASFRLLSRIKHPAHQLIMAIASHALGPKGLIHGQVMDLSGEMSQSLESLLRTHELKTARLIQLALLGGYALASPHVESAKLKQAWRMGHAIGVVFQLLDDLGELTEKELSPHEKAVNPWPVRTKACSEKTVELLSKIENQAGKAVRHELSLYFKTTHKMLRDKLECIEIHLADKNLLMPVMALLQRLSQ
jgi:geranylgeranyl pyrophosphate synthase